MPKLSPVTASARYLQHLRGAWDARVAADDPALALDRQDVFLTVPASFDEEARELTLRAAEARASPHVTLLEEPQAACYAWIDSAGERWRRQLRVGDLVLVCDVGGGTTDFSLILVSEHDGDLALERVAIGDHILLGGDNMDLALARRRAAAPGRAKATASTRGSCRRCGISAASPRRRCSRSPTATSIRSRSSARAAG